MNTVDAVFEHIANPRILMMLSCECPRHAQKEWMHSSHVRREIKRIQEQEILFMKIQR